MTPETDDSIFLPGATEEENKLLNEKYNQLKKSANFDEYGDPVYLLDEPWNIKE